MKGLSLLPLFAAPIYALPAAPDVREDFLRTRQPDFEWTAWGDSYASGVGTGQYINGRRCLRYDGAYPQWIDWDWRKLFPGNGGGKLNNVVCSGASTSDVTHYQFYQDDQSGATPNWQFYPRPGAGHPSMGTLTIGGDDVDFIGIISNCLLEGFPAPISWGIEKRTCAQQLAVTWDLLCEGGDQTKPNTNLVNNINNNIVQILNYGHNTGSSDFRLYVTGYAKFFNDQDTGCDTITFARYANPHNDGKPHYLLTTDLRKTFNAMSVLLYAAIKQAITNAQSSSVKYIDIDGFLDQQSPGHRFCEPGMPLPLSNDNNPNLWFWHYPYATNDDATNPTLQYLNTVANSTLATQSDITNTTTYHDYTNDVWGMVDEDKLLQTVGASSEDITAAVNMWPDIIGVRARMFHPNHQYANAVYQLITFQYLEDTNVQGLNTAISSATQTVKPTSAPGSTTAPATSAATTQAPPKPSYAAGQCCFHLNEYETCDPESDDLYANVTMVDNNKNTIFQTPSADLANGMGDPINVGNGTQVQGPLPNPIVITGEHDGDYVRFTYGSISWTSKDAAQGGSCNVGGWNPRDGPDCDDGEIGADNNDKPVPAENQMDCCFPC